MRAASSLLGSARPLISIWTWPVSSLTPTLHLSGIVAALAVVEARRRAAVRVLRLELEARRQHLLHQQARGDGLERVVDRLGHGLLGGVRLGDQVGEAGAGLARRVAGGAADDLHDLGQARAIADGQRVLAPDPVEAFLRHAEGDDDVHMVAVVLLRRVFQRGGHPVALRRVVIDQIGDPQHAAVRRLDQLEAGRRVDALPLAQLLDDVLHLLDLVLRALARVDVRDVDDRLLGRVEHLQDVVDVGAGVEEVADVELLQVLVAVELLVVGVGDGVELRLVLRGQHRLGVAAEVGAGHRDDVHLVAGDELAEMLRRACCPGWPRRGGTRPRRSAGRRTPRRRTCPPRSGRSRGCRPAPCRRCRGTRRPT